MVELSQSLFLPLEHPCQPGLITVNGWVCQLGLDAAEFRFHRGQFRRQRTSLLPERQPRCEADFLRQVANARPPQQVDAARVWRVQPGNSPQQRRFARTVRPDQAGAVAVTNRPTQVAENVPASVVDGQAVDIQDVHGIAPF
jgi:hypothetical protein